VRRKGGKVRVMRLIVHGNVYRVTLPKDTLRAMASAMAERGLGFGQAFRIHLLTDAGEEIERLAKRLRTPLIVLEPVISDE